MIPKISKFYYYYYSDDPHSLIQLIAETNDYHSDSNISASKLRTLQKQQAYCNLLNTIEFTIESYCYINFFANYEDLVESLPFLCDLLKEFGHFDIVENIHRAIGFHKENLKQFQFLQSSSDYDKNEIIYEKLDSKFDSDFNLSKAILHLSEQIKGNPNDFCLDENGETLEKEFTGLLETYYENKNLQKKYSFYKGKVYGECLDFDFDGNKRCLYFVKSVNSKDRIKEWYKNGNLKYEKYSENSYKYWHENGNIHIESNENGFMLRKEIE